MNKSIFKHSAQFPFHISVGVILTNKEGLIATHFFKQSDLPIESEGKSDLYLLMRETIENGETLEHAIERGIQEEFGASGEIKAYIGSIKSVFPMRVSKIPVEKTTLYFHVALNEIDSGKREKEGIESRSEIQWIEPQTLEKISIEQGRKYDRSDLDESAVIKNFIRYARN